MENFKFPYFSKNIGEFWKRWHISLTTWFRDYLYIPLGGSKGTLLFTIRNISIVFLLSGLWHGANWTFVFWGIVHVLVYIIYYLINRIHSLKFRSIPKVINSIIGTLSTFIFVTTAWVFFRSDTITDAFQYLSKLFPLIGIMKLFTIQQTI